LLEYGNFPALGFWVLEGAEIPDQQESPWIFLGIMGFNKNPKGKEADFP